MKDLSFDDQLYKKAQYLSFWCKRIQELLRWNRTVEAVEAVEAIEVAEADKVKEAAEVLRSWKSPLKKEELGSHPGSWIQLYFGVFLIRKKNGRIIKYHVEFQCLFCWRLLRPPRMEVPLSTAYVTFLKTDFKLQNVIASDIYRRHHIQEIINPGTWQSLLIYIIHFNVRNPVW